MGGFNHFRPGRRAPKRRVRRAADRRLPHVALGSLVILVNSAAGR